MPDNGIPRHSNGTRYRVNEPKPVAPADEKVEPASRGSKDTDGHRERLQGTATLAGGNHNDSHREHLQAATTLTAGGNTNLQQPPRNAD